MTITTQTRTRIVSEVRRAVRFARRDAGGRLDAVDETSWVAADDLVPASVAVAIAEEAIRAAAPQIESAASRAIEVFLDRHAMALPEPRGGQLAADYFAEVRDAILDGRIDADVFGLPHSFTTNEPGEAP